MNHAARTQDIVVDEVFPHAPEILWKALTSADLMARWLMRPTGFAAVEGQFFTFATTPAGVWDGVIRCQVLEVVENERLAFSWKGGHDANVGYGSRLDTVVTFSLTRVAEGTRLRLVHSGFDTPRNDTAFTNLGDGWSQCVDRLGNLIDRDDGSPAKREDV